MIKIIAVILAAIFGIGGLGAGCHFLNNGNGTGDGSDIGSPTSVSESEPSAPEENQISEIRIEIDAIYFDDEICADVDELKQKITDIGAEREYVFIYDNAVKNTYDNVNEVLSELKDALGITINDK